MKIKTSQDVFMSIRIAHADTLMELCERIEIGILHKTITRSWAFCPHDCPFIQMDIKFRVDDGKWVPCSETYYLSFGDAK